MIHSLIHTQALAANALRTEHRRQPDNGTSNYVHSQSTAPSIITTTFTSGVDRRYYQDMTDFKRTCPSGFARYLKRRTAHVMQLRIDHQDDPAFRIPEDCDILPQDLPATDDEDIQEDNTIAEDALSDVSLEDYDPSVRLRAPSLSASPDRPPLDPPSLFPPVHGQAHTDLLTPTSVPFSPATHIPHPRTSSEPAEAPLPTPGGMQDTPSECISPTAISHQAQPAPSAAPAPAGHSDLHLAFYPPFFSTPRDRPDSDTLDATPLVAHFPFDILDPTLAQQLIHVADRVYDSTVSYHRRHLHYEPSEAQVTKIRLSAYTSTLR